MYVKIINVKMMQFAYLDLETTIILVLAGTVFMEHIVKSVRIIKID